MISIFAWLGLLILILRISQTLKTILQSRLSSLSLVQLEKIERAGKPVIAGDSQCFWLLSSLLARLKEDGFIPLTPLYLIRISWRCLRP